MLTDRGTKRIVVVVRKDGGGGVDEPAGAGNKKADESGDSWKKKWFGSNDIRRVRRVIKTNLTQLAVHSFQNIERPLVNFWLQGIGIENGDDALKQITDRKTEIVRDGLSAAMSVSMGVFYGSWGGPVGMIVGGITGAMSSVSSLAYKYSTAEREFNYNKFKENNSIQYTRARANISLTTGRLR